MSRKSEKHSRVFIRAHQIRKLQKCSRSDSLKKAWTVERELHLRATEIKRDLQFLEFSFCFAMAEQEITIPNLAGAQKELIKKYAHYHKLAKHLDDPILNPYIFHETRLVRLSHVLWSEITSLDYLIRRMFDVVAA